MKSTQKSIFARILFYLSIAYAIAIAYEQAVQIEVFKPYRILGIILIIGSIATLRLRFDTLGKLSSTFLAIGFVVAFVSFALNPYRRDIFENTALLWAFNIGTYLAILSVISSRRDAIVLAVVHSFAILTAAYGIAKDAAQAEAGVVQRVTGDFGNPSNASVSLLFACLVILTSLKSRTAMRFLTPLGVTVARLVVPAFFLYAASLTGSRAGTALMFVGLIFYYVFVSRQRILTGALLTWAIVTIVALSSLINVGDKISSLSNKSILIARVENKGLDTDRLYLWRSGIDAVVDSYGLGTGTGRYAAVHKKYFARYADKSDRRWLQTDLSLHNDFVTALVEYGILGFVIFILMCRQLVLTALSIKSLFIRAISLSVLIGMVINGLSHTGLPYFCYWFYFALMAAWHRLEPPLVSKTAGRMRASAPAGAT